MQEKAPRSRGFLRSRVCDRKRRSKPSDDRFPSVRPTHKRRRGTVEERTCRNVFARGRRHATGSSNGSTSSVGTRRLHTTVMRCARLGGRSPSAPPTPARTGARSSFVRDVATGETTLVGPRGASADADAHAPAVRRRLARRLRERGREPRPAGRPHAGLGPGPAHGRRRGRERGHRGLRLGPVDLRRRAPRRLRRPAEGRRRTAGRHARHRLAARPADRRTVLISRRSGPRGRRAGACRASRPSRPTARAWRSPPPRRTWTGASPAGSPASSSATSARPRRGWCRTMPGAWRRPGATRPPAGSPRGPPPPGRRPHRRRTPGCTAGSCADEAPRVRSSSGALSRSASAAARRALRDQLVATSDFSSPVRQVPSIAAGVVESHV